VVVALAVVVLAIVAVTGARVARHDASPPLTAFRTRIVTVAESQLGYRTDPSNSYCNKFSAYWGVGTACGHGLRSEEWCADFAAWVWRQADAQFTYSFATGDINSAAGSFYVWAVAHGTWHPVGDGYRPKPGDVAVYGLNPTTDVADHVAIVTGFTSGDRGPDVVNGDGDRTAFSAVETGTDQFKADAPGVPAPLSGYASPIAPPSTAKA
jgi:CHAP domain